MYRIATLSRELPCKEQGSPEQKMHGNPPALDQCKSGEESPECLDRSVFRGRSLLSNPPTDAEKDIFSSSSSYPKFEELSCYDKYRSPLANPLTPRTFKARFLTKRRPSNDELKEKMIQKLSLDAEPDQSSKKGTFMPLLSTAGKVQTMQEETIFPLSDAKRLEALLKASISRLTDLENEKLERYEKWKQEAVAHGMSMVEEERTRSDREHAVLLKRILFLTEELEEANKQFNEKECEELAEWAEQLTTRNSTGGVSTKDIELPQHVTAWTQCGPTNWLAQSAHANESESLTGAAAAVHEVSASPRRFTPRRMSFSSQRRYSTPAGGCLSSSFRTPPLPCPAPGSPASPTGKRGRGGVIGGGGNRESRGTSPSHPNPPAPPAPIVEDRPSTSARSSGRAALSCRYPWSLVRPNPETGALEMNPDLLLRATEPLEALVERASMNILAMTRKSWFGIAGGA